MTIVDIAKESGYSISTVSRVLNNRSDVSPVAKKKIMEIVEAHNFVPNNNAKHLKQTTTKSILILVKGTSNMLFSNIIEEIQSIMEESAYETRVYYLDEDQNEVEEAIRLCRERKPLGILFLGGNMVYFQAGFGEVNVPCVLVTNQGKTLRFDNLSSVATDDKAASEVAVDYLFENGHEYIAEIGGDIDRSTTAQQRHIGLLRSFEKHGRVFNEELFERARFSYDSAYRAMNRLLDKNLPITAVYAISDTMAIGAIRAIRDRGLNVPNDISIVGFDGITLADYYNPKIVTIRQRYKEIARRSVEIMFNMVDLNTGATHELIPFVLNEGESVKKI
ncbi:MAG: LacI family DNA-binding transcriptional regulator [Agathobacter sp.]|nr:LacI family DNA-binding transcriptional regulator [Agathobacter sp.]